jgi:hypothetical protein
MFFIGLHSSDREPISGSLTSQGAEGVNDADDIAHLTSGST